MWPCHQSLAPWLDKAQWSRDIVREERARALGYTVIRVTAELFRDPWSQVLRVHQELVRRGYRGGAPACSVTWGAAFGAWRPRRAA